MLGPPGSGKSTQAERLRKDLDLIHIDIGSELRAAAEADTLFGRALNDTINRRRELVSDGIVEQVLIQVLKRLPAETGTLIDGAPRRASQIDEVVGALELFGRNVERVIFIGLSEKESVERLSKRYLCFGCHKSYIFGQDLFVTDALCTLCGGRIGQRKDDTMAGIRTRYRIFHAETLPVIEYFGKEHKLLRVDGTGTADEVFAAIMQGIVRTPR